MSAGRKMRRKRAKGKGTMTPDQKAQIVAEARELVERTFEGIPLDGAGGCLYLTWGVCTVAKAVGLRLIMQAGTAYWPRVTDATDDGIEPNVFGYEWHADSPQTKALIAADQLPEIHIWAGNPITNEIVDLTPGAWPSLCRDALGVDWKAPTPPPFYWADAGKIPGAGYYKPERSAVECALRYLRRALGHK